MKEYKYMYLHSIEEKHYLAGRLSSYYNVCCVNNGGAIYPVYTDGINCLKVACISGRKCLYFLVNYF